MEIVVNSQLREVANGVTVAQLVAELGLSSRFLAVERNEVVVPLRQHAECQLQAGDRVEIVTLVGGG